MIPQTHPNCKSLRFARDIRALRSAEVALSRAIEGVVASVRDAPMVWQHGWVQECLADAPRMNYREPSSHMAKTCIICSGPAGSGEHTFPAAFGGRRENKGIYCTTHNNEFGRHVAALLESMDFLNAQLGVIPDRKEEVRPARAVGPGGEEFLIAKGKIELSPPPDLKHTPDLVGKKVGYPFAHMEQAENWKKRQERAGFEVDMTAESGPASSQFIGNLLNVTRTFGTEPFMRGVVYLALTFLAHAFPDLARSASLAAARELITKDGAVDDRVWWIPPAVAEQGLQNPFKVGHSIVIAPDEEGRRVVALVSFYNALHLVVNLGKFIGTDSLDQRFTAHIDPMARRPPHDRKEYVEQGKNLAIGTPEDGRAYLHALVAGEVPNPLYELLAFAKLEERKEAAAALLPKLQEVAKLSGSARDDRLREVLKPIQQKVLNLMIERVAYVQQLEGILPPIHEVYGHFVAMDEERLSGISAIAESVLTICCDAFKAVIDEQLKKNTLTVDVLADLIGGGRGYKLVSDVLHVLERRCRPRDLQELDGDAPWNQAGSVPAEG